MINKITSKYFFSHPELEEIGSIFDGLSFNIFTSPVMLETPQKFYFLGEALLDNATDIICSIDFCCKQGYYSVGYMLLRQLCECVMQYLFIYDRIHDGYKNIGEQEQKIIEAWLSDDLKKINSKVRRKYLSLNQYKQLLGNCDKNVEMLFQLFTGMWSVIENLNDYVHINGEYFTKRRTLFKHDIDCWKEERELIKTTQVVVCMLLCIFAIVNPIAFRSNDYVDMLDEGLTPIEGTQYLVAPLFTDFLQRECAKINSLLYVFIQQNNRCGMKF